MSVKEIFRQDRLENHYIREWKRFKESEKTSTLIEMWQKWIAEVEG